MRLALFATTVLLLTLLACDTARACNCLPVSPSESMMNADVVFDGELIRITRLPSSSSYSVAYTFKVHKSLKGTADSVVSLFSDGTDCDAYFEPGFIYRVYASDVDGAFRSGTCAGNEIMGAVAPRSFTYVQPHPYWSRLFMNLLAVCGLGVLLGSGVFVWRRYVTKLT